MSHPDLVQRHFAAQDFRFASGYQVVPVEERTGRFVIAAEAVCDELTVSDLVDAGKYDQTAIQLALNAGDMHFLETGERTHGAVSSAAESSKIKRAMVSGPLSMAGLDDHAMALLLTGGMPVRFDRRTTDYQQFKADATEWGIAPPEMRYGLDFTDSLLSMLAVRQAVEIPPVLRPAPTGFGRRVIDPRAEAVKTRLREVHLRTHFLHERFAQNAGHVSILAVFPSTRLVIDAI